MDLRISHVALGVADVAASQRFYQELMGLTPTGPEHDGIITLGHGTGHHVLEIHPGSGVDHFGLEVRGVGLASLASRLEAQGHPTTQRGGAVWTEDPDGNRIELHGPIDRTGERTTDGAFRPQRTDHITFGSAQLERMVDFYNGGLGMRISDRMENNFVWLRGSRHHHDVAVVRADTPALDHYSYEVCSWGNLLTWSDRFAAAGIPLRWGPGRHGAGHNLFVFVADPDNRQVELSCDMEQFWDDLIDYGDRPRIWRTSPRVANLWGPVPQSRITLSDRDATTPELEG